MRLQKNLLRNSFDLIFFLYNVPIETIYENELFLQNNVSSEKKRAPNDRAIFLLFELTVKILYDFVQIASFNVIKQK